MTAPTLLILAAGLGSRYGGTKFDAPVGPNGESIVEYSIFDARRAGFGRIVFVIRREQEQGFREMVAARFARRLTLEFVIQDNHRIPPGFRIPPERKRPWGTAHAVLGAAATLPGPFGVINVDDFYGAQSFSSLAAHLRTGDDQAMVGFVLRNTLSDFGPVARAICEIDEQNRLRKVVEMKNIERDRAHARNTDAAGRETLLTGSETVSMNMWGFTPAVFAPLREHFVRFLDLYHRDACAECFLPNIVNSMIQEGQLRVKVLPSREEWFGITWREDHPRAVERIRRLVQDGHYPRSLWAQPAAVPS